MLLFLALLRVTGKNASSKCLQTLSVLALASRPRCSARGAWAHQPGHNAEHTAEHSATPASCKPRTPVYPATCNELLHTIARQASFDFTPFGGTQEGCMTACVHGLHRLKQTHHLDAHIASHACKTLLDNLQAWTGALQ